MPIFASSKRSVDTPSPLTRVPVTTADSLSTEPAESRASEPSGSAVQTIAASGFRGVGSRLPYFDRLQRLLAPHDIGTARAFIGVGAASAASAIGAGAFTQGERAAFRSPNPDLRTVAHEVTHVLQQRAGLRLPGGVGTDGDRYERQADAVAARVVQGRAAGHLLGAQATPAVASASAPPVQRTRWWEERVALRKSQYKKGLDPDEAREKRRDSAEDIRREKRQELLNKRRFGLKQAFSSQSSQFQPSYSQPSPQFQPSYSQPSPQFQPSYSQSSVPSGGPSAFSFDSYRSPSSFDEPSSFDDEDDELPSFAPLSSFSSAYPSAFGESYSFDEDDPPSFSVDDLTQAFDQLRISFTDGKGDLHVVYPDPQIDDLIVYSTPTPLATIIATKKWETIAISAGDLGKLKTAQTTISKELKKYGKNRSQMAGKDLRDAMTDAADILETISNIPIPDTKLGTSTNYPSNSGNTEGKKVVGDPLSLRSSVAFGFGPSKDGRLMTSIRAAAPGTEGSSYVQMHLLNDNVFGPGQLWNLTPGPTKSNSLMEKGVETDLKKAVIDKGVVMTFKATVTYPHDPMGATDLEIDDDPDYYRFSRIDFEATQWAADSVAVKYKPGANIDQEVKDVDGAHVLWDWGTLTPLVAKPKLLSTTKWQELARVDGISDAAAKRIVAFNNAGGFANVGLLVPGAKKKEALLAAVKKYEATTVKGAGGNFSLKWDANAVLWR